LGAGGFICWGNLPYIADYLYIMNNYISNMINNEWGSIEETILYLATHTGIFIEEK
jgi:hypothetical protein